MSPYLDHCLIIFVILWSPEEAGGPKLRFKLE
jgi:hypothetical protein